MPGLALQRGPFDRCQLELGRFAHAGASRRCVDGDVVHAHGSAFCIGHAVQCRRGPLVLHGRRIDIDHAVQHWLVFGELGFGRLNRLRHLGLVGLGVLLTQGLEDLHEPVDAGFQRRHIVMGHGRGRDQVFDGAFQSVRQLTQAHGAGQTRAALEGVQRAHAGRTGCGVVGRLQPVANLATQLGQQLQGLFLEDREQVHVHAVDRVNLFFGIPADGCATGRSGLGRSGQLLERLELGHTQWGDVLHHVQIDVCADILVGRRRRLVAHQSQVRAFFQIGLDLFLIGDQAARLKAARGFVLVVFQAGHQLFGR